MSLSVSDSKLVRSRNSSNSSMLMHWPSSSMTTTFLPRLYCCCTKSFSFERISALSVFSLTSISKSIAISLRSSLEVTRVLLMSATRVSLSMRLMRVRVSVVLPEPTSPVTSANPRLFLTVYSSLASASLCCSVSKKNRGLGVFWKGCPARL